jgi:hypothetical protein
VVVGHAVDVGEKLRVRLGVARVDLQDRDPIRGRIVEELDAEGRLTPADVLHDPARHLAQALLYRIRQG